MERLRERWGSVWVDSPDSPDWPVMPLPVSTVASVMEGSVAMVEGMVASVVGRVVSRVTSVVGVVMVGVGLTVLGAVIMPSGRSDTFRLVQPQPVNREAASSSASAVQKYFFTCISSLQKLSLRRC